MFRLGIGYDIHQLVEAEYLILGGIKIKHNKGLLGHSDADVLTHAIIDAMLGALALSDIGTHFPDTDPKYKNISSLILLQKTNELIQKKGYQINNIDSNIIAQSPKLMPFISLMRSKLAQTLNIKEEQVSIKAKTNEKMDSMGQELSIQSNAVVMLIKKGA